MISRTAKTVLAATVAAAGLSVALASPAAAAPAYCYASASGTQFRAMAYCRYLTPSGSFDYSYFYGAWRTQGDPLWSTAACGAGWSYVSPNAQVR